MWLQDFIGLFFPSRCIGCGEALMCNEQVICLRCNLNLPRTNFHHYDDNLVSRIFWGRINLYAATAYLFFHKGGNVQRLMHQLKYQNKLEAGLYMGKLMGYELINSSLFNDIEVIIPVPLHKKKQKKRGFNQSEIISNGIGRAMDIPVSTIHLLRKEFTSTQTKKSRYSRWQNVSGKFSVQHEESLIGKHILLVDDVLTTGATIEACAEELLKLNEIRVSVATLAYALE